LGWRNSSGTILRLFISQIIFLARCVAINLRKTFKEKLTGTSMTSEISPSLDELTRLAPV
jgi:hypothetical protein